MKTFEVKVIRVIHERWIIEATDDVHAEHLAVNREGRLDAEYVEVEDSNVREIR